MRSRPARLLVLLLALGLIGTACSKSSKSKSGEGGTITINGQKANNKGTKDFSGKSEADIEMDNFYFDPTVIKGKAGQTLEIKFENESKTLHNFTLDGKDMGDVQAGKDATFTVTFPQSGTLEFHCKYHQNNGMLGELSV